MQKEKALKILFTGPESTGKTTLAQQAASYFQSTWVPEYARQYLENLPRPYVYEDILHIAQKQMEQEAVLYQQSPGPLFCDTSVLVCKVWAEYKFGFCPPWILTASREMNYDYIFLCDTDVPWQYDPLREHPEQREALKAIYLRELQSLALPFEVLNGSLEERLTKITQRVEGLLTPKS